VPRSPEAPTLAELQRGFAAGLLAGKRPPAAPASEQAPLDALIDVGRFPAAQLLQIYRNNFFISLGEALRDCYPVVAALLGDGYFRQLARHYVAERPSRSGNLQDYGADLADFIAADPGLADYRFVADVARLEWARQVALHAADTAPIARARLDAIPGDAYAGLRFSLQPAATLLRSDYPLWRIWRAHQADADGQVVQPRDMQPRDMQPRAMQQIDLAAGGEFALVYREDLQVVARQLDAPGYRFLHALGAGETLADAAAAALDSDPQWPLQNELGRHLASGLLSDLR